MIPIARLTTLHALMTAWALHAEQHGLGTDMHHFELKVSPTNSLEADNHSWPICCIQEGQHVEFNLG